MVAPGMVSLPGRHRLDLRGVTCPTTWARAKIALERLGAGEIVEILTDDPRSARDIPAAAEAEGYAVVDQTVLGTASLIAIER
jgi:TusA-related sulfurtransferase